ncbi:hypothetical protein RRG08_063152 [Elysia crispata]|uniref:Uncharacterized protein n=1 Tax=Elysia crispata TaxID=231223 RepID=A0AAE0YNT0_9GAST|nr:hypothetical protein RRG08_063152 [Elysia crispata]
MIRARIKNYTEQQLCRCPYCHKFRGNEIQRSQCSLSKIPIGTLHNKMKGKHTKNVPGHQTALAENEEKVIVDYLLAVASWGFPFSTTEVQLMVFIILEVNRGKMWLVSKKTLNFI